MKRTDNFLAAHQTTVYIKRKKILVPIKAKYENSNSNYAEPRMTKVSRFYETSYNLCNMTKNVRTKNFLRI